MRNKLSALFVIGLFALLLLAGGVAGTGTAVATNSPHIGSVVNASGDHVTNNEITIAMNPTNPSNLVAGWNDWNRNEGCGTSRSTDGGATWSHYSFIPGLTPYDNNGNTYAGNGPYDFARD